MCRMRGRTGEGRAQVGRGGKDGDVMTDTEKQTLNQRLAEALEAAGFTELAWEPELNCPQDHNAGWDTETGALCGMCMAENNTFGLWAEARQHAEDATWHPEWRFGRVPKPFHTSMDLTITALNALGMEWRPYDPKDDEWMVVRETMRWHEWAASNSPAAIAEALVACAVEVLRREREGMS